MSYKLNIRPQSCKFIVDKEHRAVVCIIDDTEWELYRFLSQYLFDVATKDALLSNKYVGVAICAPEDEWDEQLGRRIAYHKAKMKFDTSFFKHANKVIDAYDESIGRAAEALNAYGRKALEHMEKRDKALNAILDTEE